MLVTLIGNHIEAPISFIVCQHRALCGHAIRNRYFSPIYLVATLQWLSHFTNKATADNMLPDLSIIDMHILSKFDAHQ